MTRQSYPVKNISIHALRGEGDAKSNRHMSVKETFQSTPSVGRATRAAAPHGGARQHFNPRPPWGGRQISSLDKITIKIISIHALRGEGDSRGICCWISSRDFNPRPPWEGDLDELSQMRAIGEFQSTPSVGRATSRGILLMCDKEAIEV